jgi:hypothetical protein
MTMSDLQARREQVVRGFYETGRVFKGSKAAFADKISCMKQKQQILW